jgi:hypothetical protein
MRINDIVKTAIALSTIDSIRAQPAGQVADRQGTTPNCPNAYDYAGLSTQEDSDTLDLSQTASSQQDPTYAGDDGDAPLGAIVDSFVRQRSIYQIALPIQTASGQGFFSLTVDVERAYRVIEFLPGQTTDTKA